MHNILESTFTENKLGIQLKNVDDYFWLVLFGDTHADTPHHDKERFDYFLQKCLYLPNQDNVYYFGLGDYNDFMSTSEKKNIEATTHESTIHKFDEIAERSNQQFAQKCKQMIGKTLGLIEGNHSWVFSGGKTSGEDLAERLKTTCVGGMAHLQLIVSFKNRSQTRVAVNLAAHHGKGGGKRAGSTINNVEDLYHIFPMTDICAMGHDHQRGVVPRISFYANDLGKIKQRRTMLVRTGCFLKSYTPNEASYAVKRMYQPTDMGGIILKVGFHRNRKNGDDYIITDIEATL